MLRIDIDEQDMIDELRSEGYTVIDGSPSESIKDLIDEGIDIEDFSPQNLYELLNSLYKSHPSIFEMTYIPTILQFLEDIELREKYLNNYG